MQKPEGTKKKRLTSVSPVSKGELSSGLPVREHLNKRTSRNYVFSKWSGTLTKNCASGWQARKYTYTHKVIHMSESWFAVKLHTIIKHTANFVAELKYNTDQISIFTIIPFPI